MTTIQNYQRTSDFVFLQDISAANAALRGITTGFVGLDTEFTDPPIAPNEGAHVMDPWVYKKLCVVQLAIQGTVFIIAVKAMKGFPDELRHILESPAIAKGGVGFLTDGKVLSDAVDDNLVIRNFVDIGLMTKFCNPEGYLSQDQTSVGLDRCVLDVLGLHLDKSGQKTLKWDGVLTDDHKLYAGLDAQASLEVLTAIAPMIITKAQAIRRPIPIDWYSFDYREGHATRLEKSIHEEYLPWAARFCTWYQLGRFQGYHF
ncbi:ribonuclease H-like domain-containing protein [Mycena leptocephala]|nr:ribonuclease H-like domain-containing protein [Mycena leptocephala]